MHSKKRKSSCLRQSLPIRAAEASEEENEEEEEEKCGEVDEWERREERNTNRIVLSVFQQQVTELSRNTACVSAPCFHFQTFCLVVRSCKHSFVSEARVIPLFLILFRNGIEIPQ